MTDKEAIERLKNRIIQSKITFNVQTFASKDIEAIQHVLDELEKRDKIIDRMAEQLAGLAIFDTDKDEPLILGNKEEVKQYFEKEVEEK